MKQKNIGRIVGRICDSKYIHDQDRLANSNSSVISQILITNFKIRDSWFKIKKINSYNEPQIVRDILWSFYGDWLPSGTFFITEPRSLKFFMRM